MLKTKIILGYLGFVPFGAFTILPWVLGPDWLKLSQSVLVVYGGIILSFLGGVIWQNSRNSKMLVTGIAFSLVGFSVIIFYPLFIFLPITILFLSYPLLYWYEKKSSEDFKDEDYQKLRLNLTTGVMGCFFLSIITGINV
jgi:hypothetical protein